MKLPPDAGTNKSPSLGKAITGRFARGQFIQQDPPHFKRMVSALFI
jgi:hypothetical protein